MGQNYDVTSREHKFYTGFDYNLAAYSAKPIHKMALPSAAVQFGYNYKDIENIDHKALETQTFFVDTSINAGANLGGKVKVGHDFDFKKDMGLELSAGVSHDYHLLAKEHRTELAIGAEYKYEPHWGTLRAGVEAGARYTTYDNDYTNYVTPTVGAEVKLYDRTSLFLDASLSEAKIGMRINLN